MTSISLLHNKFTLCKLFKLVKLLIQTSSRLDGTHLTCTNCQDKECTAEVLRNVFLDTLCKSFDFVTAPRINTDFLPLFVLVGPKRFNRFLSFFPQGTSAFHKLLLIWNLVPCQSWQNINIFMLNRFFVCSNACRALNLKPRFKGTQKDLFMTFC